MPDSIRDGAVAEAFAAARAGDVRRVLVDGRPVEVPYPYPSPVDWRDTWIYFLLLDRFNNPAARPRAPWNQRYDFRQGGTFAGVTAQLDYLAGLGVGAIWLSPVVRNVAPDWRWNYHGYAAQDFLAVDERFASDGTRETAERELTELVDQAHARGIRIVLDIVLNHAGRVFDYVLDGVRTRMFTDAAVLDGPPGSEQPFAWLDAAGELRTDWPGDLGPGVAAAPDDAVRPAELRHGALFRRRGTTISDRVPDRGPDGGTDTSFVRGDFADLRQLRAEYEAQPDEPLRAVGRRPVLNVLIQCYCYLIARYDFDGLRIDTAKYVSPRVLQTFGNAIREFGYSIGKRNLFTFGEVYDEEETIAAFVGRNGSAADGFGIDSALDFPLFFRLPGIAVGTGPVESLPELYAARKAAEAELLSSHGEAGRFFVTFLDNHDQLRRFRMRFTPDREVWLGLALLFALPGIPCVYYGTEADLVGTVTPGGLDDLTWQESCREALWGKPRAFDPPGATYRQIAALSSARAAEPTLCYGRLYFREVSGNGTDFGLSEGAGGIVAFSRILADRETTVVANTSPTKPFSGWVIRDPDIGAADLVLAYGNTGVEPIAPLLERRVVDFWAGGRLRGAGPATLLALHLEPSEIQVWTPA